MKKLLLLVFGVLFIFISTNVNAQGYKKDGLALNVGLGFGLAGIYGSSTIPPISASLGYGVTDKISVGGIVGYSGSSYKYTYFNGSYEWKYSYIIIGARGEYHFNKPTDKLDPYAGLTLGYDIVSVSSPSNLSGNIGYSAETSYLLFGFHGGLRYALNDKLGVFGEVGYGVGYLTVGAFFRL